MTKKQLASYIRKIVKEEVTLEMNKLLKEIFIDGKKKQISETKNRNQFLKNNIPKINH